MSENKTIEPSAPRLVGDKLHVSPAQFALLQQAMCDASIRHDPDTAARIGLRAIGLTDEQIDSRQHRETEVVVHYGN